MNLEEKLYRENIKLASFKSRFFAFVIDKFLISFIVLLIYWGNFSSIGHDYFALRNFIAQLVGQIILLSIAYECVFLLLYGATLGKIVFKIRVVSISLLDSPTLFVALVRSSLKVISENLLYVPYALVFFSSFSQTLHDYMAKTIVIQND